MELVEGSTLPDRLAGGLLPIDESLSIARGRSPTLWRPRMKSGSSIAI
jgi:hypothetical protein